MRALKQSASNDEGFWQQGKPKLTVGNFGGEKSPLDKIQGVARLSASEFVQLCGQSCKKKNMFDTHTHIQFKVFDQNRDQVLDDAKKAGIKKIIAVGTNLESSKKAVDIAQRYPQVFASVGIHPHHVFEHFIKCHSGLDPESIAWILKQVQDDIAQMVKDKKVLAIGETGMDRHIYPNTRYKQYEISDKFIALQKELFELQIKLAISHKKSLIIHNRKAAEETIEVLTKNWDKNLEGRSVFHMCEPDQRLLVFAKEHYIYISFGGDITYDSAKQDFLKKVPLKLLVLETDSPFFVPINLTSPNTPANLKIILEKISEILKVDQRKLAEITTKNSLSLFSLSSFHSFPK